MKEMRTIPLIIVFLFIEAASFSQSDSISDNGFLIPQTINECIGELDKSFTLKAKKKLMSLDEDTIGYLYDVFIIDEWLKSDSSRLKNYFKTQGLRFEYEMEYFIELAFYRYLRTGNPDISKQFNRYVSYQDSLTIVHRKNCEIKSLKDSLDGVYIPKDIYDCYDCLNILLCDSLRQKIRNSDDREMFSYHFSLGLWIRNNWGLWSCSRLSKYFRDNNIRHPDSMSGIILEGYRLFLNDTILSVNDLKGYIPPPPPPSPEAEPQVVVKYVYPGPYQKRISQFLRTKKIYDFEIAKYSSMK